jgi:hypothetical protein
MMGMEALSEAISVGGTTFASQHLQALFVLSQGQAAVVNQFVHHHRFTIVKEARILEESVKAHNLGTTQS